MADVGPKDFVEIAKIRMVGQIIREMVAAKSLPKNDVAGMIQSLRAAFEVTVAKTTSGGQKPAIPIDESVKDNFIVCLEDGRQLKMLKRHLRTEFNMTPDQYRQKWGLPANYPMVAPAFSKPQSVEARASGSGSAKVPSGKKKPVSTARRTRAPSSKDKTNV